MKDADAYRARVACVFGPHATTSNPNSDETNVVTAYLNGPDEEYTFRRQFSERLKRLSNIYQPGDLSRSSLLRTVNEIATAKNWEGAYAELAAYDYFHGQMHWIRPQLELDKNIDGSRTYTADYGNTGPANLDLYFANFDVYADVKCLKDNVADVLDGIYSKAFPDSTARPDIMAQRRKDMPYDPIVLNRSQIIEELKDATAAGQRPTFIKSRAVPELSFVLKWAPGTLSTIAAYSAYRHAEETHQLVFRYTRKFVRDRPSIIVLVNFAWFNQTTSEFRGANATYYRSVARRIFCQYKHDTRLFKELDPKFRCADTIYDVTRKLSALLFLEDHLYREPSDNIDDVNNVHGFLYVNPNADNHLYAGAYARDYFSYLRFTSVDAFTHDNY